MSATPSAEPSSPGTTPPSARRRRGWTAGRIASLVVGCILGLISLGALSAGGWVTWATNTQRDAAGYLTTSTHTVASTGHAVTSDTVDGIGEPVPARILGTVRVRATATNPADAVFIGIARSAAVDGYLGGVGRTVVTGWAPVESRDVPGAGTPKAAPADAGIWAAQVSGPGTQTLTWRPANGNWTVVVMQADGGAGVSVAADVGATVPDLFWFAVALFAVGGVLLVAAILLIAVPINRAMTP